VAVAEQNVSMAQCAAGGGRGGVAGMVIVSRGQEVFDARANQIRVEVAVVQRLFVLLDDQELFGGVPDGGDRVLEIEAAHRHVHRIESRWCCRAVPGYRKGTA